MLLKTFLEVLKTKNEIRIYDYNSSFCFGCFDSEDLEKTKKSIQCLYGNKRIALISTTDDEIHIFLK